MAKLPLILIVFYVVFLNAAFCQDNSKLKLDLYEVLKSAESKGLIEKIEVSIKDHPDSIANEKTTLKFAIKGNNFFIEGNDFRLSSNKDFQLYLLKKDKAIILSKSNNFSKVVLSRFIPDSSLFGDFEYVKLTRDSQDVRTYEIKFKPGSAISTFKLSINYIENRFVSNYILYAKPIGQLNYSDKFSAAKSMNTFMEVKCIEFQLGVEEENPLFSATDIGIYKRNKLVLNNEFSRFSVINNIQ